MAGYVYTVTRNLDGSGRNLWYAGDAIFNTGTTGDGFIDLYSRSGVKTGTGPTIVGNVRNSATYNDWTEYWAIGNLNGIYGYGSDTYGIGLGKYSAGDYITIDTSNGIRFLDLSDVIQAQLTGSVWTLGEVAASKSNVQITSGAINLRTNTTVNLSLDTSGNIIVGEVGASKSNIQITSGALNFRTNTTVNAQLSAGGILTLGNTTNEHISILSTAVHIKDGADVYANLSAGSLTLGLVSGGEYVAVSSDGVEMFSNGIKTIDIDNAGAIIVGEVGASKSNVQITSGAINFRTNTTTHWSLSNAGVTSLNMINGGDITMIGSDSDPAKLIFEGTEDNIELYTNTVGKGLDLVPVTSGVGTVRIGLPARVFSTIAFNANVVGANDYFYALGGIHVGGTADPGTDNLIVDGDAGIGLTPSYRLDVKEDIAGYMTRFFNDGDNANRGGVRIEGGQDNGLGVTYYMAFYAGDQTTAVGYVTNNAGTFSLFDPSDKRLKTKIVNTSMGGLDIINSLKVRDFELIKQPGITKTDFIAQELQAIYPCAVCEGDDEEKMLGVSKEILVTPLVKAQQEHYAITEDLIRRVELLEVA